MKRFSTVWPLVFLMVGGASGLAGQSLELASQVHPSQISDTGAGAEPFTTAPRDVPKPPSLSADGRYVVFLSTATNLVPGQKDLNLERDVFLRDLVAGTTTLVSRSTSSRARTGNRGSEEAVISRDGRYIAFVSRASDLLAGQQEDDDQDLLLYDQVTRALSLVASTPNSSALIHELAISADGRYIAFASSANDLVPGQSGSFGSLNVFLYDREQRSFRLVSHTSTSVTTPGNESSDRPVISADGRYIAFWSSARDLVPGQGQGSLNIFLYDRTSEALTLIGAGLNAAISADGKYVAFADLSGPVGLYNRETRETTTLEVRTDLSYFLTRRSPLALSADGRFLAVVGRRSSDAFQGLFFYDRISRTYTGPASQAEADAPAISDDGRLVAFASSNSATVPGQIDRNGSWDVFLFDRASGRTALASQAGSSESATGNFPSQAPALSANGTVAAFASTASDLVAGLKDLNEGYDFFIQEVATRNTSPASPRTPELPSLSPGRTSTAHALSADGRFVAFESDASHLIPGQADANGMTDIFLWDRATRTTILVSRSNGSPIRTANGRSLQPRISADGRYTAFYSSATDLAPGIDNPEKSHDVFLFDRVSGTTTRAGRTRFTFVVSQFESLPPLQISPDGRWLAFTSHADDLVPGQREPGLSGSSDVFLWDRVTGGTTLVSRSHSGATTTGNSSSFLPELSADGRFVAFTSTATDLVPGQTGEPGPPGLFLYDRSTGTMTLVTHAQDPAAISGFLLEPPSMSADGRFIVFHHLGGSLDPSVPGETGGIYLYDRTLGTNRWVAASDVRMQPRISADGRSLIFRSALEVVPGIPAGILRVYLYDTATKRMVLASRSTTGQAIAGGAASISADGRYVAFSSSPVTSGSAIPDLYLFDRISSTTTLASPSPTVHVSEKSESFLLSATGRQVAFTSSRGLVETDLNDRPDAYVFSLDPPPPAPLSPCKLLDTRRRADRPVLTSNIQRTVTVRGACGVPATAKQVVVKVTVFNPTGKGNLRFYPGAVTTTPSGILRFERGATRTETFTLPLGTNGTLTILPLVASRGTVHVAVEVTGYLNQ